MSTTRLSLAAASILVLATVAAADPAKPAAPAGEATAQVLLDTIRANRKALVAVNLASPTSRRRPSGRSTSATSRSSARSAIACSD